MKPPVKLLLLCSVILLCSHVSFAQEPPSVAGPIGARGAGLDRIPAVVTGLPYSSVTESETIQTGADGTRFDRKSERGKTYRDSQGRTRMEHYIPSALPKNDPVELVTVIIRDPVAGVQYFLNPRQHTARRMTLHLPRQGNAESRSSAVTRLEMKPGDDRPRAKTTVEDLGTQVIDGLLVEGKKTTMTFPADFQGNDRPFDVVTERWFSKELETYLLIKTSDPRSGEHITKTTIIDRAEPDPTLFQVPADYTITEK
jgi:hypothetical protein